MMCIASTRALVRSALQPRAPHSHLDTAEMTCNNQRMCEIPAWPVPNGAKRILVR